MKKKLISGIIMLALLLVGTSTLTFNIQLVKSEPTTWTVNDDGPADFHTIQEAINAASPEDTIYVYNGTYYEHVVVNKTVSLVGENRYATIIDGNQTGIVVYVKASNTTISRFTIQNSGTIYPRYGSGIYVYLSSGNNISHNIITNNYEGIRLEGVSHFPSSDNVLSCNIVSFNRDNGIRLQYSDGNTLFNNTAFSNENDGIFIYSDDNVLSHNNAFSNKGFGIRLFNSRNNVLSGNNAFSNKGYNFGVYCYFLNSVDKSNTVDGKPICYLVDAANVIYDAQSNAGTFYLINCKNITIRDLTLTKNFHGVLLYSTTNSKVENVTVSNNEVGIKLIRSSNNTLSSNTVSSNSDRGIWLQQFSINNNLSINKVSNNMQGIELEHSNKNSLTGNTISNNSCGIIVCSQSANNVLAVNNVFSNRAGIRLFSNDNTLTGNTISSNKLGISLVDSRNNKVYHNNFINNTQQVFGSTSNIWGNYVEGNYWSDYEGVDHTGDGIGDSPYFIDKKNRDNRPIMVPWTPTWSPVPLWMQWWFWPTIVGIGILAETLYFLRKKKPSTSTPPLPAEGTV